MTKNNLSIFTKEVSGIAKTLYVIDYYKEAVKSYLIFNIVQ